MQGGGVRPRPSHNGIILGMVGRERRGREEAAEGEARDGSDDEDEFEMSNAGLVSSDD